MSCYGDDGYYRRGGGFGYGTAFGYGLGFGSNHNGFRTQSCCSGGLGSVGPTWGYRPCGNPGGVYGCQNGPYCNPYSFGLIATDLGCGTGVGIRGTGGLTTGPYMSPCAPMTIY